MLKKYLPHLLLTLIVLVFSFSLLSNLQYPREICNDEFYYVPTGQAIWQTPNEPNLEHHPPLAKYLIGIGIITLGNYSVGWRLVPALFGILGLIIVFFLSKEVLSNNNSSLSNFSFKISYFTLNSYFLILAPFLLAFDFLYFTMSRQAMLDIFVTVFLLMTALFLWKYIQTNKKLFLILLAISFGLAMASKWTTILFTPLFLFLTVKTKPLSFRPNSDVTPECVEKSLSFSERDSSTSLGMTKKVTENRTSSVILELAVVILLSTIVYFCTYIPYLMKNNVGSFLNLQKNILVRMLYTKDSSGNGTSPFNTIFWPFFPSNTLSCYFDYEDGTNPHSLSIISHPLIIWLFWPVLIYSFYQAFKRKEIQRFFVPSVIICLYIPWIAVEREKYFYYMTPVMPFLCILIAQVIIDLTTIGSKDSSSNLPPQKSTSLPNKDLLDKIIIVLYKLQEKIRNSKISQTLSQKIQSIINNKKLLLLLITVYLLLITILFIAYYPLLNGLPVSNTYRDNITFFWPFLF